MWRAPLRLETEHLRARLQRVLRDLRRIFDMPDYPAYREHCARSGTPPRLSAAEYLREFFAAKANRARCC